MREGRGRIPDLLPLTPVPDEPCDLLPREGVVGGEGSQEVVRMAGKF